jgi:hypothetical protein
MMTLPRAHNIWKDTLENLRILDFVDFKVSSPKSIGIGSEWSTGEEDGSDMEGDVSAAEVYQGLDDDMLLMVEVILAAFVGSLVISLIDIWIYRRRFKTKAKRSSHVSQESDSDEIPREWLTEAVD